MFENLLRRKIVKYVDNPTIADLTGVLQLASGDIASLVGISR